MMSDEMDPCYGNIILSMFQQDQIGTGGALDLDAYIYF